MENVLYNELCMRGYSVDVGVVTFHTRNADGVSARVQREIDFVANEGSRRYYIQLPSRTRKNGGRKRRP